MAEIRSRVRPALLKHGIIRAFLFGSTSRGDIHKLSDIDIAIEIPKDSTMDLVDFVGLGLELEAALGRKVDMVNLNTMKPQIRDRAQNDQVPLL
ncbi:MAG: nucleotidyltransferase domain-containing protein [Dehalococcoidia bacterium]|nr:nucleotidyltransferase domain-containing protein [Dehalococcoidia bacterium]